MTRTLIAFLIATVQSVGLFAQTISGNLALLANQSVELHGFNGLNTYPISHTVTDNRGSFNLSYTPSDFGIGYLLSSDNNPLFVVLSGEDIELVGNALKQIETIRITHGQENQWFEQYAYEHSRREQALSGWLYLERIYEIDTLLSQHSNPKEAIQAEKQRLNDEDSNFLSTLPKDSYVSWYLPIRKLISSASSAVKQDEIATLLNGFRGIDYSDPKLYKSGLLKEAIDNHFGLIENSGLPLDSVYLEMQISIDGIIEDLLGDEQKLNEITNYLFDLLERHSLFQASEYLALKILNDVSCTIESGLANQLETYRAMKKGNTAADILFKGDNFTPGYGPANFPRKLSDIKSEFTLVVFGASWCPKCTSELPEIARLHSKWKSNGIEVVHVSLDEEKNAYHQFVKDFPFISTCDFKKWDSQIAKDYYVFGTPTMFLLDEKRTIILRPISVKQVDSWVDVKFGH